MKKFLIAFAALALPLFILAQEYIGRAPTAAEQRRVAGLNFYPAGAVDANWYYIVTSGGFTNIYLRSGRTNNVMIYTNGIGGPHLVTLPNCSNSVGQMYNVIAVDRTPVVLTNINGNTFSASTGAAANVTFVAMRTNQLARVFSPTGTNWFVMLINLGN